MTPQSQLARARADRPGVSDAVLVEDLAEEIGRELELTAPVDLALLASYQGIGSIGEEAMEWSGYLCHTASGLQIRVNASHPETRQRFTTAHEVSHTLLPGFTTTTQFRCSPDSPRPGQDTDIERLADVGASEFLLPRRLLRPHQQSLPFGFETVDTLAAQYNASREAVGRRVAHLAATPVAFVDLRLMPSKNDATPRLRVRSSYTSKAWRYFIPRNKSVERAHALQRALEGELVDEAVDLRSLTGTSTPVLLSARASQVPIGNGETMTRVLAIAQALPTVPRPRL